MASSIVEPKYPAIWGIATFVADVASIANAVGTRIEIEMSHNGAFWGVFITSSVIII